MPTSGWPTISKVSQGKRQEQEIEMSEFVLPLIMLVVTVLWFVVAYLTRKTNPGTSRLGIRGGILAAVMTLVLALIVALQVKITAVVAVPLFVAAIFEFAFIITLTARTLGGRISYRSFMVGILTIIAAILIGVVLMFQPITPKPFNLGFDFVLIALLAFNIWSHVTPKPREQK
jgi:hypothetical protein